MRSPEQLEMDQAEIEFFALRARFKREFESPRHDIEPMVSDRTYHGLVVEPRRVANARDLWLRSWKKYEDALRVFAESLAP